MKRMFNLKKGMVATLVAAVTAVAALPTQLLGFAEDAIPVTEASWEENMSLLAASSVSITKSIGYAESACVEWQPVSGADGYNVYCNGVQLDSMLIRQYKDGHLRADAVGLKAGSYTLKVVPVSGSTELSGAAEATVTVTAHDRSGFGFVNGTSSGAYNDDGTLKSDAVVLYITENTKDTVSMEVVTTSKGVTTACTGIQNILTAYQKGYDSRPLCIRCIGNINDPAALMDGDLLIKGNGASKRLSCGITIEGIGADTVFNGFGLRIANASNVEVRNIGFMNCNSGEGDDVGLQQNNDHIWVHNCDFFYGDAGSDADQVKGDGALDTKTSSYITHSYNHFWDNGKCNLQGMKSESTENYITYHHNWYDHSDSRHPRIRTCSVHSYNNYFDGNAKYGVGVTMGASAFVENNYFRNCKNPMLISGQGTDALGEGTFSGETGGIIKACNNHIEGAASYITYAQDNTQFDAYEVSSPSETVPSSVKTASGGTTYNNFDTNSSLMYSYTAESPEDAKATVMAKAGRADGGDLQWKFDNSVDDASYAVNEELKAALTSYTTSISAIGSGFSTGGSVITTTTTATTQKPTTTTTAKTTTVTKQTTVSNTPTDGDIFCSPTGSGSGKSASDPTSVYTAVSTLTPGHTIYLLGGTYELAESILIEDTNSGTASAPKTIKPYNGANVVFDFTSMGAPDAAKRGVILNGDYWHFYGFEITKAADNGMLLSGNNNTIEMMVFNDNQDTGLQISRYNTSAATIADWPSNNLILNCTSKNNCDDETMENADGFAAKLTCGEGNVFDGCMAYNNSDDGWDLFAKPETGPIGVVTIQNSIAFRNGFTEFGEGYGDCDGNGFKLGGSGIGSPHVVKNCLAFENLHCGFTDNNNPKLGTIINCTAVNNNGEGSGKPNFSCYRCTNPGCDFDNLMSYYDASVFLSDAKLKGGASNDKYVGTYANGVYYNSGYYKVEADTAITNGAKIGTKYEGPAASDFISMAKAPTQGTDFHTTWRNADGSLNPSGLYETKTDGTYGTMGYHMYNGTTPGPIVTTTVTSGSNTTTTTKTTTTKTTTTSSSAIPSGAQIHNFTENGLNSTFYTITGNLATNKGTVSFNGLTLTQCLKLETATSIGFTNTADGTLTLVFVEPSATIKVDGTKYTANGDGIITVPVTSGTHSITKANTASLFYMVYSDQGTEQTSTTPSSTTKGGNDETAYGDTNLDGIVDLRDAITLNKYLAQQITFEKDSQPYKNSDVNADGNVDDLDSSVMINFVINLIDNLPYTG